VAGVELPNVEKRHGEAVLKHNAGGHSSSNNLAKNALSFRDVFHGSNGTQDQRLRELQVAFA
jgi:hypothetical protein